MNPLTLWLFSLNIAANVDQYDVVIEKPRFHEWEIYGWLRLSLYKLRKVVLAQLYH